MPDNSERDHTTEPRIINRFADVCIEVLDCKGRGRMLRGLLDSGCSKSIILRHFVDRGQLTNRERRSVTYNTYGGKFRTKSAASVGLRLIEFSNSKTIKWEFQVDEYHHHEEVPYDMIIGSDLMAQLGLDIKYSNRTIQWQGDSIPLKELDTL